MNRELRTAYGFIAPAMLLLVVILGFPAIVAILQSVNLALVSDPEFTFANYTRLAADPQFLNALANTVVYVGSVVTLHLILGLAVALLLNADIPGKWFFRVAAILPWTIPDVIGGIIWRFLFDALPGLVNAVALRAGWVAAPVDWLGNPALAMFAVVMAETWRGYPFVMLILLAGLQTIPRHHYEAAAIDGANRFQSLLHITLPALMPMLIIAAVLDVIWECRLFGMVFGMTGGGPGNATEIIPVLTYRQYFEFFNTTYASAIAVALAVIMLLFSTPYLRMSMREKT